MNPGRFCKLVFLFLFVIGQLCLQAHASSHITDIDEDPCVVCLVTPAADDVSTYVLSLSFDRYRVYQSLHHSERFLSSPVRYSNPRAPPYQT